MRRNLSDGALLQDVSRLRLVAVPCDSATSRGSRGKYPSSGGLRGVSAPGLGVCATIWAAMMVALYAAFWLQLESASSAAVTVGILALQTRGQAYQKAVYRILCTIIGVVASFAIAGLFAQSRELFVLAFAGWLGLCVYVGGFLDGNRAYGAVLAGYTVALVAVTQIHSPASIFDAGVNRGAAVVVGIAALALISDGFAAPNLHPGCPTGSLQPSGACVPWRAPSCAAKAQTRSSRRIC